MVVYRRALVPGGTFFFTVALQNRHATLLTDHVALLRDAFLHMRCARPFRIDAIVILPEHLHSIWTLLENDADYSGRWRAIKSRFVRLLKKNGLTVSANRAGEHGVWQRRFWEHTIRDARDLQSHVDYIHFNPVKHGYVSAPANWQFSSIHRYIHDGLLNADWGETEAKNFNGNFAER